MEKGSVVSTVVIILFFRFQCTSSVNIQSDFSHYCPYTKLCTQEARLKFNATDKAACCLPCSCSSRCGLIGKCCPDVANVADVPKPYHCRRHDDIFQSYLKTKWVDTEVSYHYVVIDECPLEALSRPELSESVAICHNATGVEDLIFVTGVQSDLTYLNKHCAICNQESLFTEWKLYLLDKTLLLPGVSVEERERNILSKGGIMVVPPTTEIGLKALCNAEPISYCNYTNKWNFYDGELKMNCRQQSAAHLSVIYDDILTYANVYCFLCNHPNDTPLPSDCPEYNFGMAGRSPHQKPFSALFIPNVATKETTECAVGETMDPFRRICTSLFCPFGMFPQAGDCVDAVKDLSGYVVHLQMDVNIDNYEGQSKIDNELLKQDIVTVVMNNLNRGNVRCGICGSSFVFWNKTADVRFVRLHMLTNESCFYNDLLEGIAKFIAYAPVRVYLSQTQLHVTLITSNRESNHQGFLGKCEPEDVLFSNKVVFCPSILLSVDDSQFTDYVKTQISSNSVMVGNGTVRICLKNYISILKATGLISVSKRLVGSMFVLILTACLFQVVNDI